MFDVVRLIGDLPRMGCGPGPSTIVEVYEKPEPAYKVEFPDGTTVAVEPELLSPR
jgi:hypothetical protein